MDVKRVPVALLGCYPGVGMLCMLLGTSVHIMSEVLGGPLVGKWRSVGQVVDPLVWV